MVQPQWKAIDYFVKPLDNKNRQKRPLDLLIVVQLRADIDKILDQFLENSTKSSKYAILKLIPCDKGNFDIQKPICDQVLLLTIV